MFPVNLYTTSGLSILLHDFIALLGAMSYDKQSLLQWNHHLELIHNPGKYIVKISQRVWKLLPEKGSPFHLLREITQTGNKGEKRERSGSVVERLTRD